MSGRTIDEGACKGACWFGTCSAAGSYQGCGGCCGCFGGCQVQYEGLEVRRQYRVSDRRLVHICMQAGR